MNFKMKASSFLLLLVAALGCCVSCIESNSQLGGDLVPVGQTYDFYTAEVPIENIDIQMTDSLSGYSTNRVTVGAVRDEAYGLCKRSSAIPLIPLFKDEIDFGKDPVFKSFHFAIACDTVSVARADQDCILQGIKVYELDKAIEVKKDFDCNKPLAHQSTRITKGTPIYNGQDSLSFDFSASFGQKYLSITKDDLKDINTFLQRFPGIYLESETPTRDGGRINIFELQLGYNSDYQYIEGNYAKLRYNAEYNGVRKDTTLLFYYGADKFYDIDSLLQHSSKGKFPQYALNLSSHSTSELQGPAADKIYVEGGGGLKPHIPATELKRLAEEAIAAKGHNPKKAVINKATIVMPFEAPDDFEEFQHWPYRLSPTCKIGGTSDIVQYIGISDSSSEDENQGDINRSILQYAPDITYHLQEILRIDPSDALSAKARKLADGYYDVWLLIMANEVTTTTTSGSSDMSEMYQYLAYQSYYNDMYGGGYGGGYGGSYYNNYYNYAMLASLASQSQTTETVTVEMDKDRYYKATLNGPASERAPKLRITFAVPKED